MRHANDGTGRRRTEEGFALAVALLALLGITALATAGFVIADTDYDTSGNYRSSVTAFYVADAGHNRFLAEIGVPVASTTYYYGSDSATSRSTKLADLPEGLSVFQVSTEGLHAEALGGHSLRRVNSIAVYTPFPLNVLGAFTAANGLVKQGVSGMIDGNDDASPAPCPYGVGRGGRPAVAGVAVPKNGYTQHGNNQKLVPVGDPPVDEKPNSLAVVKETGIDWQGLVTEDKVQPDYRIPGDAWPDFSTIPPEKWPIIHVTASHFDLMPTHSGWGTIILDQDVSIQGNFQWGGLVLVGGRLVSDGNQVIRGSMYTGLNRLLGQQGIQTSEIGNGMKTFLYHSCNVEAAARSMGWLAAMPGSWYETH